MKGARLYSQILGLPDDVTSPNYYDLLGIEPFCEDEEQIRDATIRQNAKLLQWQNSACHEEVEILFQEVAIACDVLLSPETRARYDRTLSGYREKKPPRDDAGCDDDDIVSILNPEAEGSSPESPVADVTPVPRDPLRAEVEQALFESRYDGLLPKVQELLRRDPDDAFYQRLQERLLTHAGRHSEIRAEAEVERLKQEIASGLLKFSTELLLEKAERLVELTPDDLTHQKLVTKLRNRHRLEIERQSQSQESHAKAVTQSISRDMASLIEDVDRDLDRFDSELNESVGDDQSVHLSEQNKSFDFSPYLDRLFQVIRYLLLIGLFGGLALMSWNARLVSSYDNHESTVGNLNLVGALFVALGIGVWFLRDLIDY